MAPVSGGLGVIVNGLILGAFLAGFIFLLLALYAVVRVAEAASPRFRAWVERETERPAGKAW